MLLLRALTTCRQWASLRHHRHQVHRNCTALHSSSHLPQSPDKHYALNYFCYSLFICYFFSHANFVYLLVPCILHSTFAKIRCCTVYSCIAATPLIICCLYFYLLSTFFTLILLFLLTVLPTFVGPLYYCLISSCFLRAIPAFQVVSAQALLLLRHFPCIIITLGGSLLLFIRKFWVCSATDPLQGCPLHTWTTSHSVLS